MNPVDPCIDPRLVPEGSVPRVINSKDHEFVDLPSVITPGRTVITRWHPTEEERAAIVAGADIFLTIYGAPIRPVWVTVGPCDWTQT